MGEMAVIMVGCGWRSGALVMAGEAMWVLVLAWALAEWPQKFEAVAEMVEDGSCSGAGFDF